MPSASVPVDKDPLAGLMRLDASRIARQGLALRTAVAEVLRKAIIHRVLPPGAHLVEDDVASHLQVSRNPIREAFRFLEQDGWLVSFPGSGVFVAEPSRQDAIDSLDVRSSLESLAASLAAERATDIHTARLKELIKTAKSPNQSLGSVTMVDLNSEFHRVIAEASGNRELIRLLGVIGDKLNWLFSAVVQERVSSSWREHAKLVAAIQSGDSQSAAELAVLHVRATQKTYLEHISAASENG